MIRRLDDTNYKTWQHQSKLYNSIESLDRLNGQNVSVIEKDLFNPLPSGEESSRTIYSILLIFSLWRIKLVDKSLQKVNVGVTKRSQAT